MPLSFVLEFQRKISKTVFFAMVMCVAVAGICSTAKAETVYSFGVVPQFEPRKLASIWLPVLEKLEKKTGLKFKMVGSPRIPDFELSFTNNEFDFAYMNPYHAMLAASGGGYVPLVKDANRKLFGVLVVRKDDAIKDVSELKPGTEIAFPSPNALGASLLMRADLGKKFGLEFTPVYVQTHSSVYLQVVLGKMRAGGGVMGSLKGQKPEIQKHLRVLYETRRMSPHPVMAHSRVPADHRERVRQAFIEIGQTDEGRKLLSGIPMNKVAPAAIEDYMSLADWGLEEYYVKQ